MNRSSRVQRERIYASAPEFVWEALTTGKQLEQWLLPTDFEAEEGQDFVFLAPPSGRSSGIIACRVLALDPPHRLVFTWQEEQQGAALVAFTLEPVPTGTKLTIRHTLLEPTEDPAEIPANSYIDCWVNEGALIDSLLAYIRDPWTAKHMPEPLREIGHLMPGIFPVIDEMVLDGVAQRPHLAHVIHDELTPFRALSKHITTRSEAETPIIVNTRFTQLRIHETALVERLCIMLNRAQLGDDDHQFLSDLADAFPEVVVILETMRLDGVTQPEDIVEYLRSYFTQLYEA